MAKKKLSKKEQLERLKKAKVKQKTLEDFKKEKDSKFRKEAEKESLLPSTDLNSEIRSKTRKKKFSPGEIQAQKNRIKVLEKENAKIQRKRKQLEEEYTFSSEKRKKEIENLLDKPDYKKKDLFTDKNLLKYMQGKDFDFVVDDGFEKFKINSKEFKKQSSNLFILNINSAE